MAKKTAVRKARPKRAARMEAPSDGVAVRMYRQGLGDCFLLALPTGNRREPFYLMIDCGVLLGTPDADGVMTRVANDIAAATGGNIHLLVVTHEHWDHVSGFLQAREVFEKKIKIHQIWLAWTEDPGHPLARKLRAERRRTEQALHAALQGLRAAGSDWAGGVENLLGFFGAAGRGTTSDALDLVQDLSFSVPRYCRPADSPARLAGVDGVRIFVLGPPEDEGMIKKSRPTKTGREVYEEDGLGLDMESAFFAAAVENGDPALAELSHPFDRCHRIAPEEAQGQPFFQERYFGDSEWRRIDKDWLSVAAQLALQLDSNTNNTSLALAIELVRSGKVLLFPADAQVGNWLSWDELSWELEDGDACSAQDLLERTVLYKVGHHGSHNATMRKKGLERMISPELMALIPVSGAMAGKRRWNMPFPPLSERLEEKTRGRVIRADESASIARRPRPSGVPAAMWAAFRRDVRETELYFEVIVRG